MKKKVLCLIMALAMVMCVLPLSASAAVFEPIDLSANPDTASGDGWSWVGGDVCELTITSLQAPVFDASKLLSNGSLIEMPKDHAATINFVGEMSVITNYAGDTVVLAHQDLTIKNETSVSIMKVVKQQNDLQNPAAILSLNGNVTLDMADSTKSLTIAVNIAKDSQEAPTTAAAIRLNNGDFVFRQGLMIAEVLIPGVKELAGGILTDNGNIIFEEGAAYTADRTRGTYFNITNPTAGLNTYAMLAKGGTIQMPASTGFREAPAQYDCNGLSADKTFTATREGGTLPAMKAYIIGKKVEDGWRKTTGGWQYVMDGHLATGLMNITSYKGEEQMYYFDPENKNIAATGFRKAYDVGVVIDEDQDDLWCYFGEFGSDPEKSRVASLYMDRYVQNPTSGYRTPGEGERDYYYYFNEDGIMYTGWHNDRLTINKWRYFGEKGASPVTSTLGRRFAYGAQEAIGNNGETNLYMFTQTGNMYYGKKVLDINGTKYTFTAEGEDPATDALGKGVMVTK